MHRWIVLALLVGCEQETSRAAPDALPPDATQDDALVAGEGRPAGAACERGTDCAGACLPDAVSGALRCHLACADPACPPGSACPIDDAGQAGCVPQPARGADGDACGIDRPCGAGLACLASAEPAVNRCAPPCEGDADCPADRRCQAGACLAEGVGPRCPEVACARPDLVCEQGLCLALCADLDAPCPEGGRCRARPGDGARVCQPDGGGGEGAPCASGGAASCRPGLACLERVPGDPAAVCARACGAEACAADFACRRPEGFEDRYCLATPFRGGEARRRGGGLHRPRADGLRGGAGLRGGPAGPAALRLALPGRLRGAVRL
ncbi:MAG: hypothetical protein R3F43_29525 [bacterium]